MQIMGLLLELFALQCVNKRYIIFPYLLVLFTLVFFLFLGR